MHISELLQQIQEQPKEKLLYPRQELIKKFVDRLNAERDGIKYKKLSPVFIASKMYNSGLKDDLDLQWFYGYCNDARNFSKCWWWALKG